MFKPFYHTHPLVKIVSHAVITLPAPKNLSSWWNFGSLLGLCLGIQLLTGIFLAMHYLPSTDLAFLSVNHISRDVNYGWLLRSVHVNTASFFFLCVYLHVARGVYYGSFRFTHVWNVGVILLILLMATAFLGYVLPWGQMSFWAATVITNLLSAIPYVGLDIVQWLWGGFAVGNATLNRFFSLHFMLPFVIAAASAIHILFLHQTGSNNPLGIVSIYSRVKFHPYYTSKDLLGFLVMLIGLHLIVFFFPLVLGDPENFIPANPLMTPPHIKPEWYFLWAYAILRSIPNKLGGVVALFAAILVLFTLPLSRPFPMPFNLLSQGLFWGLGAVCLVLTWIGACPVEAPFEGIGQVFTFLYFGFYVMYPASSWVWKLLMK